MPLNCNYLYKFLSSTRLWFLRGRDYVFFMFVFLPVSATFYCRVSAQKVYVEYMLKTNNTYIHIFYINRHISGWVWLKFMSDSIFIIILREWIISKTSLNCFHRAINLVSAILPRITRLRFNRHLQYLYIYK